VDAIIPGDVRQFLKDIDKADFTLPDWPAAPEFNWDGIGAPVENGIVQGMRRSMDEWGRVYMGEGVKKSRIQEFQANRDTGVRGLFARQKSRIQDFTANRDTGVSGLFARHAKAFRQAALPLSRADRQGLQRSVKMDFQTPELKAIQKAYDDELSGKIYAEAQAQNRTLKSIDSELKKRPSVTW
jgi:hypothetical protein